MKRLSVSLIAFVLLTAGSARPSSAQAKSLSPRALVVDLYRQHDRKHSPFFQKKSRALVNKYFVKALADLIWKDATTSRGDEVGALDGDPLYDAQDMEIKNFVIGKVVPEGEISQVPVSFENFGRKVQITFLLIKTGAGWRISDIKYETYTLRGILKEQT